MSKKFLLNFGSSPIYEECVQTTDPDYGDKARRECQVYANQLSRIYVAKFATPPSVDGLKVFVKGQPHDFGTYYEVVCSFDESDGTAAGRAFWLDEYLPEHWDDEAEKELGL